MFSGSHFIFTNGATVWKIADASCTEACANIGLTCSESELAALTGQAAALAAFRAAGITCKGVNDWDYGHGISQCTDPGCCLGACIGACSVPKTKVPGACVLLLDWFSRLAICNTMLPNNATHFAPNVINTRFRHMPHRLCTACTFYVLTYTVTLCGLHKKNSTWMHEPRDAMCPQGIPTIILDFALVSVRTSGLGRYGRFMDWLPPRRLHSKPHLFA